MKTILAATDFNELAAAALRFRTGQAAARVRHHAKTPVITLPTAAVEIPLPGAEVTNVV